MTTPHGCASCEYRRNLAAHVAVVVVVLVLLPLSFFMGWPTAAKVVLALLLPISVASVVMAHGEHRKHVEEVEQRRSEKAEGKHGDPA